MRRETLRRLEPLLAIPLFGIALWAIHRELATHSWREVLAAVSALPRHELLAALGLTVVNFFVLSGYDTLGLRYVGRPLAYRRSAFASFLGYSFSNTLGFPLLTSAPIRYRLYSSWGLSLVEIRNLVVFYTASFWLGFALLAGVVLMVEPERVSALLHLPDWARWAIALFLLAISLGYLVLAALRRAPLTIWKYELPFPRPRMALGQLAISSLDWAVNAGVLYLLLPPGEGITYPSFVAVYLLAQVAGLVSHVPGGLGVFEAVIIAMLPGTLSEGAVLGSLLAFRGIFYLLPLLVASIALVGYELRARGAALARAGSVMGTTSAAIGRTVSSVVPLFLGVTTFTAGLVLLFSGATPAAAGRLRMLSLVLPLPLIELSHFVGSAVGATLLILGWGLQRRLDAAWYLAVVMLALGVAASLAKGLDYEEAAFLTVMLVTLASARGEFYRRTSLLAESFSPGWAAAVVVALLASGGLALFAYKHVDYSGDLWWQFALRAQAPRALRAEVGALVVVLSFAAARLVRPMRPALELPGEDEMARAAACVERSASSMAWLALTGDKRLMFSDSGESMLMYGVEKRSWVAMGDPVGAERERAELAWRFRELVDEHGGWTVFYQVRPEMLPLYIDLGLGLVKLGEEARVPLQTFTLEGGAMKNLRQQVTKAEREGVEFALVEGAEVRSLLDEMREVSQEWLAAKKTREKGFSVGSFHDDYLQRCPIAVVRRGGRVEAFANVWRSGGSEELSVDLMRHRADAPRGIMDFLFVQLMLRGRAEGWRWFNLGMAPLSGLESRPLAPLWARLGVSVQRVGEPFYGFAGLRAYKEKFRPVWEPRYLASPGGLALPIILTNVASLIAGGLRGTLAR